MKFHVGITLKELFKEYKISIPAGIPDLVLSEPLAVYGQNFIDDLKQVNKQQEIDEQIYSYLTSKQFLIDATNASKELCLREKFPQNFYWLQFKYIKGKDIQMTVDMDMKDF